MRNWLRRIRGAIGMGFTWGVAWSVAGWGAIGGLLLSAVFATAASLGWGDVLVIVPTFALASAACASGSLALARRAVRGELPEISGDIATAELTDHKTRKLI
jgi:hypothetical protein